MEIITRYFIAMAFMLMFLFFWMLVQKLSRKVAKTHPEFGPAREEGGGCGGGGKCNCTSIKSCTNPIIRHKQNSR
ncbi:MAG: chemotaxis protein [Gammaproteobacteria bacterium]|nr:chemotaxis protein [Gammaproteobacteria bacterium]